MPWWVDLITGAIIYAVGYYSGQAEIKRQRKIYRESKVLRRNSGPYQPMKYLRGRDTCDWCNAKTEEWCSDDCTAMDPWDYR